MIKALILQGWYQKTNSCWYQWLKKELEKKEYKVYLSDLPTIHTDLPDWEQIQDFIVKTNTIDKDTTIIGHSLGCLMVLRLAEKYSYTKMFLVSGWDFNDLTPNHQLFWKKPLDHSKIENNVKSIVCIGSDNDPYFTFFTTEEITSQSGHP